jgi:hypothetical protein
MSSQRTRIRGMSHWPLPRNPMTTRLLSIQGQENFLLCSDSHDLYIFPGWKILEIEIRTKDEIHELNLSGIVSCKHEYGLFIGLFPSKPREDPRHEPLAVTPKPNDDSTLAPSETQGQGLPINKG